MEPDEIRAEIYRRKKRAEDLKLREILWSLYYRHLMRYEELVNNDPQMLFPEVKERLDISGTQIL